jgi:hypothetical protein
VRFLADLLVEIGEFGGPFIGLRVQGGFLDLYR